MKSSAVSSAQGLKDSVVSDAQQVEADAKKKADDAKATGSSWFSWGKTQAVDTKKEAAGKVADGAENVRDSAAKRS